MSKKCSSYSTFFLNVERKEKVDKGTLKIKIKLQVTGNKCQKVNVKRKKKREILTLLEC